MDDTTASRKPPSGRFVLRLPPALHATLRDAAGRAGLSLNEYCVRTLTAPGPDPTGPGAVVAARAAEAFGPALVGVVVYGSWARGEATEASDIDVLIVLDPRRSVTRATYLEWDRDPLEHEGHPVDVRIVSLPTAEREPGAVWLEAALDGVAVYDRDQRVSRLLGQLRRDIAAGTITRRRAHGQPYWTAPG